VSTPLPRVTEQSALGVVCALPGELGRLRDGEPFAQIAGFELLRTGALYAIVCGPGKVAAAHAASTLISVGVSALACVGTCGAVSRDLRPGDVVHCGRAYQADFAVRDSREFDADSELARRWQAVLPGVAGASLTADRPVISPWRRRRLRKAYFGPCVADMETAAVAAVAARAELPWAAAKIVTDRAGALALVEFKRNFDELGGRPADSLVACFADEAS